MKETETQNSKSEVSLSEERILEYWAKNKIFKKSLEKTKDGKPYVFYDGPPFATGMPHYGHLLASTIKDVIPRFQTMNGRFVRRQWGWDCHGLPIENIVEKSLGISGRKNIEEFGIEKFNEEARSKVLSFASDWRKTIERIGRWVDFDGSYKTMDNTFIESVWWAVKELSKKELLYEGEKVLPYCPRCETPISNSEIAMDNSYKDITDISVVVKFELELEAGTYFLVWTTTPWTLPGNTALAINPDLIYVKGKFENEDSFFILAKTRIEYIEKIANKKFKISEEITGGDIAGTSFRPIFDYYKDAVTNNKDNLWKVYSASFVTTEQGTGIVHIAPAYGEDDIILAKKYFLPIIHHVKSDGRFAPEVTDFVNLLVKPKDDHQRTDIEIIKYLAHSGKLFAKEKIIHSYPHCHRCETPLFYNALSAWFINVQEEKAKAILLNENINWVPAHLKEGRFKKSMESAPDWNISRNRFWASPLPIWKCQKCSNVTVIGSLEELKEKTVTSGNKYIVMRHGDYQGLHQGGINSDPKLKYSLTEDGRAQMKSNSEYFKDFGIDTIITSHFTRTRESSEIVAEELGLDKGDIIVDERLGEIQMGEFEGGLWEDYHRNFSIKHHFSNAPNGGETLTDMKNRIGSVLYELETKFKNKKILIVTHGAGVNAVLSVASGANLDESIKTEESRNSYFGVGEYKEVLFVPLPHNSNFALDFHRPYIDSIKIKCSCLEEVTRIPEVIDCWFESGSMPYAQFHYPFENNKEFREENFPAQLISEYVSQTRTWFYYTHILSSILFDNVAFENVITTGTVLAEDGQKMSKSKGNFPDPQNILDSYGADALRYYLVGSPLMRAEDARFSEKSVQEIYKKNILRIKNVDSFYNLYKDGTEASSDSGNILDRWIIARLNTLNSEITEGLDNNELDLAIKPLAPFIDDLSTWYLRRSRTRFKGTGKEKTEALSTTRYVLCELSKLIAPFTPFLAEELYLNSTDRTEKESVHLEDWPVKKEELPLLLAEMAKVREVVSLGLELRSSSGIKVRQPLQKLTADSEKFSILVDRENLVELIRDEINVKEIIFAKLEAGPILDTNITPQLEEEGNVREVIRLIQELRKTAALNPKDMIKISISCSENSRNFFDKNIKQFYAGANIKEVVFEDVLGGSSLELSTGAVTFKINS